MALQPIVKTLTPASGAKNVSPTTTISAEFQNRDTSVVLNSMKLLIDGNDVTSGATTSNPLTTTAKINYVPASALANGAHTAVVTFNDTAVPANSWTNSWSFTNLAVIPVVGFYQLNEKLPGNNADTTTNAILDFSGNSRNATIIGSALPYVTGSPNHGNTPALEFTVTAATHLVVPDPAGAFNFYYTQSVTLEAVIKTVNIGQSSVGCILAKQTASPGEWYWRISATGFQQFSANDGTGIKTANGTKALNDGQWHHIAAVYDAIAKQLHVYVDYVQDGPSMATTFSSTTSPIGNALDLWIGQQQSGSSKYDGDIDMVRVTSAALDPSWFIPLGGIASPVRLVGTTASGGNIGFSFITEAGRSYIIQSTAALGSTWSDVETISGNSTTRSVTYSITGAQKYFRIRVQ